MNPTVNWNTNHAIASSTGATMTRNSTLPALHLLVCRGCCVGGGWTLASGVGACASRVVGFPQLGQKLSPGLNSCPQLVQYLRCGTSLSAAVGARDASCPTVSLVTLSMITAAS